jgi:hypothetical protein
MTSPFVENCELPVNAFSREKAIQVTFCHYARYSSIPSVTAEPGADYENFRDADISEFLSMLLCAPDFRAKKEGIRP